MIRKKLLQSAALIALAAALYKNANAMPTTPDYAGLAQASAKQDNLYFNIISNADYITSTHPNAVYIDKTNEHVVYTEPNNIPVVTQAAQTETAEWSGTVLYSKEYNQIYADKEMTTPLSYINYNDSVQITGLCSTTEVQVLVNDTIGYTLLSNFVDTPETPTAKKIPFFPAYLGQKTYMDYRKITSTNSRQYQLQRAGAYTGDDGIRMVNGRYCIALGTGIGADVGQYVDLLLENGTVINCVVGDIKADAHTDENRIFTLASGCCSEFIVETEKLSTDAKRGDISKAHSEWNSAVSKIIVYSKTAI